MSPKAASQLEIILNLPNGEEAPVVLDARRAAFLPESGSLLVSDLHWGKSETFRKHGIPIPDSLLQSDLNRLSALIHEHRPEQLLILGDLIHGPLGLTDALQEKIRNWRNRFSIPMILIAGNHDRKVAQAAEHWDIAVLRESWEEGGFLFSHQPEQKPEQFNWCGHIHPTVRITGQADSLRLPCFHIERHGATLPAFSEFTGGYNIQPASGDQVFALADGLVIPLTTRRQRL